jgi:hypothetical protein
MNSRAITLGASVIALTLAGPGQAAAGVLGDAGQKLPDTGIVPKVEANAQVNVNIKTKAVVVKDTTKAAIAVSKGSLEADAGGSGRPRATVEAKGRSGEDRSQVVVNLDGRHGVSAYADQRRNGEAEIEGKGQAGPGHAQSTVTGSARHAGKASAHGRAHTGKAKHARAARPVATTDVPRSPGHEQHLTPLQTMGRAVGNPSQLILSGWLIVGLIGTGCLGVSRLVRRLNGTS